MEGSTLSLPRLRLTRNKLDHVEDATPVAGPSRLHDEHDSDTHSTPTIPAAPRLALLNAPTDTPAARLRALLAKVPKDSPERTPPAPSSSSELDSDFYPPHLNTTNTHHESLKELFSRALRDPGDTPEKPRRRRNSIDLSEVDASPRLDRVKTERAKSKGKRKSLSDEELEKSNRSSQSYSQATTTLRTLRQRLASSQFDIDLKDIAPPTDNTLSDTSEEDSHDTAKILRNLNSPIPSLPNVTNTTLAQSIQLPSQMDNESNLLEQDSDMHRAMKNMDSYDGEPTSPVPFPPSKSSASKGKSVLKTHHSDDSSVPQTSQVKTHGSEDISPQSLNQSKSKTLTHSKLARHHSLGSSPAVGSPSLAGPSTGNLARQRSAASLHHSNDAQSLKTSSMHSHSDYKDRNHDLEREKLKERERDWNRPTHSLTRSSSNASIHASHERARTISHPSRPNSSHALTFDRLELHRKSLSRNSMRPDSPASSVASSFDQDKDGQNDFDRLRERNRNSSHPKWTQPVQSPTQSVDFDHGRSSPHTHRRSHSGGVSDGRRSRLNSVSSTGSRAYSPAGSMSSKGSQGEPNHEIEHERERNWNAARPKWNKRHSLQNESTSSLQSSSPPTHVNHPQSRERSQSLKLNGSASPITRPTFGRNSMSSGPSSLILKTTPQLMHPVSTGSIKQLDQVPVPSQNSSITPGRPYPSSNPNSPLPTPVSASANEASSGSKSPNPGAPSHFGWKFPKNKSPLPPLEHDSDNHLSVGDRPKIGRMKTGSHIPVPIRSPSSKPEPQTEPRLDNGDGQSEVKKRGHRRSITEFSEAVGSIPPKIDVDSVGFPSDALSPEDIIHGSDEESPIESTGGTPVARQITLPPLSPPSQEQKLFGSPQSQTSTPPPSPPHGLEDHVLSLVTPPRQSAFSNSRIEFQTPSPPKGLPELPEPPESSEDGYTSPLGNGDAKPSMTNGNLTMLKTPKLPGSWVQTPAQLTRSSTPTPTLRNHPLPEDSADENALGLATPPSTLSKGNSMPQRTPAPPGAWLNTPGSLGRKSILKVRFDVLPSETETVSSVNGGGGGDISMDSIEMVHPSDESVVPDHEHPLANGSAHSAPLPEEPSTPVMRPVRIPRTPPSVRVVDAFGREHAETPKDVSAPGNGVNLKSNLSPMKLLSGSPKTEKSRMRIVDAMGREIDETPSFDRHLNGDAAVEEPRLTRAEALAKIKESVSSLAKEMNDADLSSTDDLAVDDPRVTALRDVSNVARSAREKLSQIMQRVQNAEDDPTSNYGPLREGMRRSNGTALNVTQQPSRSSKYYLNGWAFGAIVLLQIVFIVYMFRMSHARARDLFLNNYYNPFYPDIHLHITKPDTYRLSMINPFPPWSVYNIPETFGRAGLRGVYGEFWGNVTLIVSDLQRRTWEAWDDSHLGRARAWPPR